MRYLILLAGVAVIAIIGACPWIDEGEVITLVTTDEKGIEYDMSLWIVDLEAIPYLRADSPDAAWLERLRERPEIRLERGGEWADFHAAPSDEARIRDAVSRAMAAKYGRIDRVLVLLRDHSRSVPIRLEPRPPQHAQSVLDRAIGASP